MKAVYAIMTLLVIIATMHTVPIGVSAAPAPEKQEKDDKSKVTNKNDVNGIFCRDTGKCFKNNSGDEVKTIEDDHSAGVFMRTRNNGKFGRRDLYSCDSTKKYKKGMKTVMAASINIKPHTRMTLKWNDLVNRHKEYTNDSDEWKSIEFPSAFGKRFRSSSGFSLKCEDYYD